MALTANLVSKELQQEQPAKKWGSSSACSLTLMFLPLKDVVQFDNIQPPGIEFDLVSLMFV